MAEKTFEPKWRRFHTQSTVWIQNTLNHDVVYQVADEFGRSYQYRLPKGKVSELPGGKVAELGLKKIVDELMQDSKDHAQIWNKKRRGEVEDSIILKVKEAPTPKPTEISTGIIDLGTEDKIADENEIQEEKPERVNPAFQPDTKESALKEQVGNLASQTLSSMPPTGNGVEDE